MTSDSLQILEFANRDALRAWLSESHLDHPPIWLKLAKKGAPSPTVTQAEAVELALCFGWIDGQVGRIDEHYYRQRFSHRKPKSNWSQINRTRALELIESGDMQPEGLREVQRAQADGRWERAYASQSMASVPDDFAAALAANPAAKEFFETLTGARRYAFLYRIQDAKRPATRARRIANFTELLAQGRTLN